MKIMGKVVLGLLGSALLTAVILFALDSQYVKQADETSATENADKLSIEIDQHQIVHQTQEDLENTEQKGRPEMEGASQAETADARQQQSSLADTDALDDEQHEGQQNGQTGQTSQTSDETDNADPHTTEDSKRNTFQTVTEDYFSDALFIGDSRTVGMQQSRLLPDATYYAKIGIGIGDILRQRIVYEGGVMISVEEALSRHSFGKVYIMIGINDMSRGDVEWFTGQYQEILYTIRQTQPDAVIYIQGNIPMSYRTQDFSGSLNNMNLEQRNEASRQLADNENIFYLDVEDIYADVNGHLDTTYSTDGLHVSTKYYPRWVDYLLQHAIVR